MTRSMSDMDCIIDTLRACKLIKLYEVLALCAKAREILSRQGNIVTMSAPVVICGDIHGQFFDLKELFRVGGQCPDTSYVFLGDYVDRGLYSIETLLLLFALKIRYPDRICLIRGNHETRQITRVYGFYDEVVRKFGSANAWRACAEVFDQLAVACLIDSLVFCVHGGISPDLATLDSIRAINRVREVPQEGGMCDLMWSDPDESIREWVRSPRGAGFLFGPVPVRNFHHTNKTKLLARAHQLVHEGYSKPAAFSNTLVTVWSAPNYCYRCGNVAAILEIDEFMEERYKVFDAAPEESRLGADTPGIAEYFV